MATINVSTADQLVAAVAQAQGGDTILLAGGTYAAVGLRGMNFDKPITIKAANPNAAVELTGLRISESSGIIVSNVTMTDKNAGTRNDFQVSRSNAISFDQVKIQGQEGDAGYTASPFMIRDSENVSVTNSEITHARYGINMLNNTGVTIKDNYFHDLRTDGVRGGDLSDITISGNFFTDFKPAAGDHPDAIQFWTTGTTKSASNITITDNVILRGEGGAMQGIFMRDETNKTPYQDVTISNNLVVGGMYSGIYVGNGENVKVTDNTVTGYADQKSWIYVKGDYALAGNAAEYFIMDGVSQTPANNALLLHASDGGSALLGAWLAENPAALLATSGELANAAMQAIAATVPNALAAPAPVEVPVTTTTGTAGNDTLKAARVGDSILIGGKGNDTFTGGVGETRMQGDAGNDTYHIASDRDIVVEAARGGEDTVYAKIDYTLSDNVETLRLAASDLIGRGNALDNRMIGTAGDDTLYGEAGDDSLQGMADEDYLDGGDGDDSVSGGDGADSLYGGKGADKLYGDAGHDWLFGGAGADWLEGGAGNDVMKGEAGADTFFYRHGDLGGNDRIADFSSAQGDRIVLNMIDANALTAKDDAFRLIGTNAFSKKAGELRYSLKDGGALIQADVNGDGVADMTIFLNNVQKLAASDFVL